MSVFREERLDIVMCVCVCRMCVLRVCTSVFREERLDIEICCFVL